MKKRMWSFGGGMLTLLLLCGASPLEAENLAIRGSTTMYPLLERALEVFALRSPDVAISLSGSGTATGLRALLDGTADLAASSRPLTPRERALAADRGVRPVEHRVAVDAIVVIVHPSNTVVGLSLEELRRIFGGDVSSWQEVGGASLAVAAVWRDSTSGTQHLWEELVMRGRRDQRGSLVVSSSGQLLEEIAGNPRAIGYDGVGFASDRVKVLAVEGVLPTKEHALSGAYPLSRFLVLYSDGDPSPGAAAFIAFLRSPEGQRLVAQAGFVPLPASDGEKGEEHP